MYTVFQKSTNILPRIGVREQVSSRGPSDEPIKLKRPLQAGDFSIVELVFSRRINLHVPRCTSITTKASVSRAASPPKIPSTSSTINPACIAGVLGGISIAAFPRRSF